MKAKKKICLIGGSFDPIHLGHTYIAEKCYRKLNIDKIIFLPCRQSPHKLTKENAPDHHRLAMCKLAISSFPWAEVDDYDLTAPPPSYSWRTAEVMQERFPDAELYWLMGSDQWEAILKWDRAEYLATLVKFIVVSRGEEPEPVENFTFIHISGSHTASATAIRSQPISPLTQAWLNPLVLAYIQKHHVY
ncbi:MAG: nicotinate (nicotinamide) nucleotide adenylyltransferase [Akkermansiaceae bacterium]